MICLCWEVIHRNVWIEGVMHFCFGTPKIQGFKHKNRVMHFCFGTQSLLFWNAIWG